MGWRRGIAAHALDLTAGSLPGGTGFTRASAGTCFNASGLLQTAAVDAPRFDHVPATGAARGLLVEGAATNLLLYSDDLTNADWKSAGIAVSANSASGPRGAASAAAVTETAATTVHRFYKTVAGAGLHSGTTYCLWAVVKAQGRNFVSLNLGGGNGYCTFNLTDGSVDQSSGVLAHGSSDMGGGFWLVWISDAAGSGLQPIISVVSQSGAALDQFGSESYAGNGVDGIVFSHAQVETGTSPTSYIPTTSASVTRAADDLTITVPSGTAQARVAADDDSTQTIAVTAGSFALDPAVLARPWIKYVDWA